MAQNNNEGNYLFNIQNALDISKQSPAEHLGNGIVCLIIAGIAVLIPVVGWIVAIFVGGIGLLHGTLCIIGFVEDIFKGVKNG